MFLLFRTAANAIEQEGSTMIFIRSHIICIVDIMSSSEIGIIPFTLSLIIGKVIVPICALRPSQIVLVVSFD